MHCAVLGGSSRLGKEIIIQALYRGRSVTTLIRRPNALIDIVPFGKNSLHIILGDATNPDDVHRAIITADAVIHTVSVPFLHRKPTTVYSQTTQAVINAWNQTPARQYVVMSSTGTHHCRHQLPLVLHACYEYFLGDVANDKEQEESLLATSSLPRTIIKAPLLTNGSIHTHTIIPFASYRQRPWHYISRASVANIILDLIDHKTRLYQKIVPLTL